MIKNGFTKTFSGGVEAAASSGGQIMPPVMGIAAFVLAALSTVPYSEVIIAAFIPAVAYFFSLLMVIFECRRMDIKAINNLTEEQKLTREDYKNLIMIAGPILVILILLLSSKDSVGQGFSAFIFGYNPNFLVSFAMDTGSLSECSWRPGLGRFLCGANACYPAISRSRDQKSPG